MYLRSLDLHQFRNHTKAHFEFDPCLNLICGPNAQGKTSLLEAIHTLMIGRSFRPCTHRDLIQFGAPSFYLEAVFHKHGIDQTLRFYTDGTERKMTCNHNALPTLSHLLGLIQGVIMTPDDVELIKGPPLARRRFLDIQIAQADPLYLHHLARYAKAMRHRNQLLKAKTPLSIESWEHEMAQAAGYIVLQRRLGVEALKTHSQAFYAYLTEETEQLSLAYHSHAADCQTEKEIKAFYSQQFQKNRAREIILGYTLSGPHKDDILVEIGERDARYFASEGQQRSCVAALRIGEWQRLKQITEEAPLVMVDDVGVSLDDSRRTRLLNYLASLGQLFLTTTDVYSMPDSKSSKKIFPLPI